MRRKDSAIEERGGRLLKKFVHARSSGCITDVSVNPDVARDQLQQVLMLMECRAAKAAPYLRPYDYKRDLSSAVTDIGILGFIEDNHQQSVLLELRARKHRIDIVFEPGVGSL